MTQHDWMKKDGPFFLVLPPRSLYFFSVSFSLFLSLSEQLKDNGLVLDDAQTMTTKIGETCRLKRRMNRWKRQRSSLLSMSHLKKNIVL